MTPGTRNHPNKQRGKYTVKACEECRRRRAKCDGERPSCSRCFRYGVSCQYSTVEDGRRPAPKSYVLLLRERISYLERLLRLHGIDPNAEDNALLLLNEDSSRGTGRDAEVVLQGGTASTAVDDLCEDFKGTLTLDGSLNFDQDGEMRYFGPTSGRLQFESSISIPEKTDFSDKSAIEQNIADSSTFEPLVNGIDSGFGIPASLQDDLIGLYFTWEQPWYPIVDEVLFRESLDNGGRYWSPLLHNTMLALGSRFSSNLDIRSDPSDPNTAGKPFLERAKDLLYREIEHPGIITIQALGLIGMVYIAMGADSAGWLHHGMANRLCLDLGLNLDPSRFEGTNTLSPREVRLRRQIYWTLYFHDKLLASYTGRICSMLVSIMVLSNKQHLTEAGWTRNRGHAFRYRRRRNPAYKYCHTNAYPKRPNSITEGHVQYQQNTREYLPLTVSVPIYIYHGRMGAINEAIWSPKPLLKDHQQPAFLKSCLLDLKTWFYDLPNRLRIDTPNDAPQVYTLHMVYHTMRILLAKPFIMKHQQLSPSNTGVISPGSLHVHNSTEKDPETLKQVQSVCRESASAICSIAHKYRQAFGSFQRSPISATHCTLSAALVFLGDLDFASNRNRMMMCLGVLEELSGSWCPARHIANNLRRLCMNVSDEMTLLLQESHQPAGSLRDAFGETGLELPKNFEGSADLIDGGIFDNNAHFFQWGDWVMGKKTTNPY